MSDLIRFRNLQQFVRYRKLRLLDAEWPKQEDLAQLFHQPGYVAVQCVCPVQEVTTVVVLFTEQEKLGMKQIKDLLSKYKQRTALIVFTAIGVSLRTRKMTTDQFSHLDVTFLTHDNINVVVPMHCMTDTHTILTAQEKKQIEQQLGVTAVDLPKMRTGDAHGVWIGVRAGDVVRVECTSYIAGKAPKYLYVIDDNDTDATDDDAQTA